MSKESPRQELGNYANSGNLRMDLERSSRLSGEAIDLLVRVAISYCEPRRPRRKAHR